MPKIRFKNKKKNTGSLENSTKLYLKITYKGSSALVKNEFWLLWCCGYYAEWPAHFILGINRPPPPSCHTLKPLYLIVLNNKLNHKFIVARCSEIVYIFNLFQKTRKNKVHW